MITEANYNKRTMRELVDKLPWGSTESIAKACDVSIDVVRNCYYGKHYNEKVIKEIIKLISKVSKKQKQVKS